MKKEEEEGEKGIVKGEGREGREEEGGGVEAGGVGGDWKGRN